VKERHKGERVKEAEVIGRGKDVRMKGSRSDFCLNKRKNTRVKGRKRREINGRRNIHT